MTRYLVAALALTVAAGALPVTSIAFAEDVKPAVSTAKAPSVTVVTTGRHDVVEQAIVTGTLVAREEVQVSADVDGLKIEKIFVDEGDLVTAGQILAKLSTDAIDIALAQNTSQLARADADIAQQKAQIAEAEANQVQAAAALVRTQALKDKGVVAQDVLDQRLATSFAANARLNLAQQSLLASEADKTLTQAQRAELELRKSKTDITAPTAGLVLSRTARLGAIVSSGSGSLFRIAENAEIELEAEATDTILARLAAGQIVKVTPAGSSIPIEGKVRLVAPEVTASTRLGKIRISLPLDTNLRVGSFARGLVEIASSSGIALPVAAVLKGDAEPTVQVVNNGRIETRVVSTGLSGGGWVEIKSGLAEGETVVARAGTFLRDGDAVEAVKVANEGVNG
jgi:HlyD family secretion protein